MTRAWPRVPARIVILVMLTTAAGLAAFLFTTGSLALWSGMLKSANDPYLDGTGRVFQTVSWHLGNATRTWGETYGIKLNRFYLSLSVKHVNRSISPKDAHEDD